MDIEFIGQDHGFRKFEVLEHPLERGQPGDAVGIIILGDQCGTLPHPAKFVEPALHRLGGDRNTSLELAPPPRTVSSVNPTQTSQL